MGPGDSLIGYWGAFGCGGDGAGFQEVEHVVSQIIQRSRHVPHRANISISDRQYAERSR